MTSSAHVHQASPVRILHIIDSLGLGGAQALLADLCTATTQGSRTIVHEIVALHGEGPQFERLRARGVVTHSLTSSRLAVHMIVSRLALRLRSHNYDILHLHLPVSAFIGSCLAWFLSDAPTFVTLYAAKHQLSWPIFRAFRLIAPMVSRIVTVLPPSHDELRCIGVSPEKMCFIPMGLDFADAHPHRHDEVRRVLGATYGFDLHRPLLLSVARLARDRYIHVLVEAMAEIAKERPDALLLMVGSGDQQAELEAFVQQHALARNVIFAAPRMDIWNVMPGCDVYLSAAVGSGIGVAALQAMACGRPVAAYNITPTPDERVLRTEHGVFIAARDARALARVVCELITDKAKATELGKKAQLRVLQCASLTSMIARYEELYASHTSLAKQINGNVQG
jgi:glycosyltransferase involved in cell wall biosynthesis